MKLEHGYLHNIIYKFIRHQWFNEAALVSYQDYDNRIENKSSLIENRILYYK